MSDVSFTPRAAGQPTRLGRRQFIGLGAGLVAGGLAGCDNDTEPASRPDGSQISTSTSGSAPAPSALSTTRRLVVVQLNGGNDLLNTLPPAAGRYRDLRPTLAVPEGEVVGLNGVTDCGLHPSLAGLVPFWDAGRLAILRGIGFQQPNRSHFVSMDRWWRADDMTAPGWLGRVLDHVPNPAPLYASALGASAPLLNGSSFAPTVVTSAKAFNWVGVDPQTVEALAGDGDPGSGSDLSAAMRDAYRRAASAVEDFAAVASGVDEDAGEVELLPSREGAVSLGEGLAIAAELLSADVGTQFVVVSASGFDTHSGQDTTHRRLLADLNDGLTSFFASMAAAGLGDDVLVVTTSEFGRRAAENGSGGCDHGAGGLSFVLGSAVKGGIYGDVDLDNLLEGDVRPSVDPLALYTTCLDWVGADAAEVLGRRDDSLGLLIS